MQEIDGLIESAARAHAAGNLDEAERLAQKALRTDPNDSRAPLLVGIVRVKKEDATGAEPMLRRALELDPASADAPFWLSMVLRGTGRRLEAREMAARAVDADAENAHVQNQLGMCCLDVGDREAALKAFGQACRLAPNVGPFFDNMGRGLQSLGRNREAIAAFRRVLEIGPVHPGALFRLGDALMLEPEPQAAAECAAAILRMNPNSVPGNLLMARALIADGAVEEGAKFAHRAIGLAPKNAVPVAYYGRALQSLGKIEEADAQFQRSIELEPRQGFAYYSLVHNHKVKEEERPTVVKMRQLAADPGLPPRELIQLEYGLGKALEDLGEYEEAMRHYDAANRIDHTLKVGVAPFRPEELAAKADWIIQTFDADFLARHSLRDKEREVPIFVVGMMRSGTTLAEQILSSHSEIGGAGEQLFWPDHAGMGERLFGPQGMDMPRLQTLADEYVTVLQKVAPGKPRVVDKMNTNYLLLGLLHIAFPDARVVHMRRHPVDTCLSIWATPVANGIDLCARKENVVAAYEQYLRVMAHWRSVLPTDRLLDVQYEELVSDRERVTRQMIEFCGLDWDEACMTPEANTRSVKTPSVWQVRQPVYKTSVARWKKFEPWLGPFETLFARA